MRRGPRIASTPGQAVPRIVRHGHDAAFGHFVDAQFRADLNDRALGVDRFGDEIRQRLLLLEDAQDRAELAQVLKLRLVEQILRAA